MKVWTGRRAYIGAIATGTLRYGIDGTTSYITAAQTDHAKEKLAPLGKGANP